jgi:hypothetical protein
MFRPGAFPVNKNPPAPEPPGGVKHGPVVGSNRHFVQNASERIGGGSEAHKSRFGRNNATSCVQALAVLGQEAGKHYEPMWSITHHLAGLCSTPS